MSGSTSVMGCRYEQEGPHPPRMSPVLPRVLPAPVACLWVRPLETVLIVRDAVRIKLNSNHVLASLVAV